MINLVSVTTFGLRNLLSTMVIVAVAKAITITKQSIYKAIERIIRVLVGSPYIGIRVNGGMATSQVMVTHG